MYVSRGWGGARSGDPNREPQLCGTRCAMADPACDLRLMGLVARLVSSSVFSNPIVLDRAGGGAGVGEEGGGGSHYNST